MLGGTPPRPRFAVFPWPEPRAPWPALGAAGGRCRPRLARQLRRHAGALARGYRCTAGLRRGRLPAAVRAVGDGLRSLAERDFGSIALAPASAFVLAFRAVGAAIAR